MTPTEAANAIVPLIQQAREVMADLDLAVRVLTDDMPRRGHVRSVFAPAIVSECARFYNHKQSDFTSRRKLQPLAWHRQICMYLLRELTTMTAQEVGDVLGCKDHGTVLYGCKKVEYFVECYPKDAKSIETLRKLLLEKFGEKL